MSGAILFGISSVGKSYLVNKVNHPDLRDSDVLVSTSGPGFPKQPMWWQPGVLTPEELSEFGENVYSHLTRHASESWILSGIGPVPEWVWGLPEYGIDIKFIVTTKEHLASNLAKRDPSEGQAMDLDEIWSAYVDFLNIAASKGIEMIPYDHVEKRFNAFLSSRRVKRLEGKTVWSDDYSKYVHFTWNSRFYVVDVTSSTVSVPRRVKKSELNLQSTQDLIPTLSQARFAEPGTAEWDTAVSEASKLFFDLKRSI